ncbi:MAG: hypothetical protein ACRCZF_04515, partial [Gemmataceae bacterium]
MRSLSLMLVLVGVGASRADDTKDFLNPENWVGLAQYWKIEGNVITADATEDPKYNTFFVSKEKYADFELSFKVLLKDEKG